MADYIRNLGVFFVVIAIVGLVLGGAYYLAVELPQQQALENNPPDNIAMSTYSDCAICEQNCAGQEDYLGCIKECNSECVPHNAPA